MNYCSETYRLPCPQDSIVDVHYTSTYPTSWLHRAVAASDNLALPRSRFPMGKESWKKSWLFNGASPRFMSFPYSKSWFNGGLYGFVWVYIVNGYTFNGAFQVGEAQKSAHTQNAKMGNIMGLAASRNLNLELHQTQICIHIHCWNIYWAAPLDWKPQQIRFGRCFPCSI